MHTSAVQNSCAAANTSYRNPDATRTYRRMVKKRARRPSAIARSLRRDWVLWRKQFDQTARVTRSDLRHSKGVTL